ncbi:Uncharacterised protein [Bordetella pertussis]|nr:Uncharacterised protein [Bordetella pertussis]
MAPTSLSTWPVTLVSVRPYFSTAVISMPLALAAACITASQPSP